MILSAVDFPDPLAPRMIFVCPLMSVKLRSRRTTLSSKASCTRSNTTTGAPTSASTCFAVRPLAVAFMSAGIDREYEDLRDEEVCRDDCDGSGDDRQRRRLADTLRAAARPQPDVTRDSHDDESEDERLDEPHPHVLHVQTLGDRRPVEARRDFELEPRNEPPAENSDEIRDDREHRRHEESRQHARHGEP